MNSPPMPTIRQPLSVTLGKYSAAILWLVFLVIFGIANHEVYLTANTFRVTFSEGVVTAVLALAFLVPLSAGAYDLSIGANMGLSLVLLNWFGINHPDIPVALVAVMAVAACCAVGLISGLIVVRFKVNSLIATLGMSQLLSALLLKISDNRQMTGAFSTGWTQFGSRVVFGIPIILVYLLALGLALWFVLEHTTVGRYLFAVGGNPEAARLAGLNVERLTCLSLVSSAGIAGIGGVIYSMKVGIYSESAGPGLLFPALAAVFFGASQFSRRPNVWGALVAYFALAFGVKGLQISFGPGTFWIQPMFQGAALLIAVAMASRSVGQTRRSRREQAAADRQPPATAAGSAPVTSDAGAAPALSS